MAALSTLWLYEDGASRHFREAVSGRATLPISIQRASPGHDVVAPAHASPRDDAGTRVPGQPP
jgi:hypothetical protein